MIPQRRLVCGEIHYTRVPRAHWRERLAMAYAMGLDAISTYVFWNVHEPVPSAFDFGGERDLAAFVREAQAVGLDVVLRPGPYVCAEWDFGGLPAWLLADPPVRIRTSDERYMAPVRRWLTRLGRELEPLLAPRGGPIVAVQLENEYGAFGDDVQYLRALRQAYDDAGFGALPYYTIDQPGDLARGALAGVAVGVTFGTGDLEAAARALHAFRPDAPPICGEYWAGWFDHWGEPHVRRDDATQARELEAMLAAGWSVNLYMLHGGTNAGFYNGANATDEHPYQPATTSYDYQAAIDEAGRPTAKYFTFREAIARAAGRSLRPVPDAPETIAVPPFALDETASYEDLFARPVTAAAPMTMESLGQSYGYIVYRTRLRASAGGTLSIDGLRDYATVLLDDDVAGRIDRRLGTAPLRLGPHREGAALDVLVENCGRINYGPQLARDRKGIAGAVRLDGVELQQWQMFRLPLDDLTPLAFRPGRPAGMPAFFRGRFELSHPAGTFFDCSGLGKGVLFVNGHNAGRFWKIGPQRSLYVPASWLHAGTNEVMVFDAMPATGELFIGGTSEPIMSL